MTVSLVITTYNWKEALELVLLSALNQSQLPNEIIIADDGSKGDTKELIQSFQGHSSTPIIHSWQEDNGFRAASSRNKAIIKAKGEYIVLIDGDMILHPDFIKEHLEHAKKGYFSQGSRILLTKEKTKSILANKQIVFGFFESGLQNRKNRFQNGFLAKLANKKGRSLRGIKTCNLAFFKEDCLKVNGFNEDFVGWGREDSEFVVRLLNSNILRQNVKFSAIAYHIFHEENSRKMLAVNDKILQDAIDDKKTYCKNGIDKYVKDNHVTIKKD